MLIGYKKLRNGIIAKIKIMGSNNQNRSNTSNHDFASYRCSKAIVLKLESIVYISNTNLKNDSLDSEDGDTFPTAVLRGYSFNDPKFVYRVGHIVEVSDYDNNPENIKAAGIHYFLSWGQAYYWNLETVNYNGKFTSWYSNGQIQNSGQYQDGYKYGLWNEWYEDGNMKSEIIYRLNKYDGIYNFWHHNGNPYIESEYRNGLLFGYWKLYSEDGQLVSEVNYQWGLRSGICTEWYKSEELTDKNESKLRARINYTDNCKDGLYETWYPNGNKQTLGSYNKNSKVGRWIEWYADRNMKSDIGHNNCYKEGDIYEWHPNGQLQLQGLYNKGLKVGVWKEYNIDGELIHIQYYSDHLPHCKDI